MTSHGGGTVAGKKDGEKSGWGEREQSWYKKNETHPPNTPRKPWKPPIRNDQTIKTSVERKGGKLRKLCSETLKRTVLLGQSDPTRKTTKRGTWKIWGTGRGKNLTSNRGSGGN